MISTNSTTASGMRKPKKLPSTGVRKVMASRAITVNTMPTRPPSSTETKRSLMSPSMVNSMMLLRKMSQLYAKPTTCRMELTVRIQTSSIRRK